MKNLLIFFLLIGLTCLSGYGQLDTIDVGPRANTRKGDDARASFLKTNRAIKRLNNYAADSIVKSGTDFKVYDGETQLNPDVPPEHQLDLSTVAVMKEDSSGVHSGSYVTGYDFMVAQGVSFTLQFDPAAVASPTDNTLYYFAGFASGSMSGSAYARKYLIPVNCTVIGYSICTKSSAASTNETSTLSLRINNTTDVQLNNALVYTNGINCYSSMALDTDLSAGDYIEFKLLTATWATDATSIGCNVTLYLITR